MSVYNIYMTKSAKHSSENKKPEIEKTEPAKKQNFLQKLFGGINLTWPKLIISSVIIGLLVGLIMIIPAFKDTSIQQIGVIFYWWWFFAIIIIMNSKSNLDAALKCFVFFLISQPLIYLVQVPFNFQGWGIFNYYKNWIGWTIATLPMGYIGYWMKRRDIWSGLIASPAFASIAIEGNGELHSGRYLGGVFCVLIILSIFFGILPNWKVRVLSIVSAVILALVAIAIMAPKPEDFFINTSYDVERFGVTTEKEWHVESDLGDQLFLEESDIYDENGEATGETEYFLTLRGRGDSIFGTHNFKFVSDGEAKDCVIEVEQDSKTFHDKVTCE